MKMAKLRRERDRLKAIVTDQAERLEAARATWRAQRAELDQMSETRRVEQLADVRSRREDLARVAAIHHKVLRRAVGKGRAERFYCVECNVPFPCRTMDILARLGGQLDELFQTLRAA
jgi:hypothetical protein